LTQLDELLNINPPLPQLVALKIHLLIEHHIADRFTSGHD